MGFNVRPLLAVVLLGASGLVSCAAAEGEAPPGGTRSGISGGESDGKDSNVFLLVSHRGSAGVALCSASLIAPNLLLTARHCVSNTADGDVVCGQVTPSPPFAASTFFAVNTLTLEEATEVYRVSSVSVPSAGTDLCGYDLALITLAGVVPASSATPLVPRIDRPVARGELYSAVGYGLDSPGDAGTAGERRARSGLSVNCAPGRCGEGVETTEFVGSAGVCSGDSGGPALDAEGKVVGVASRSGNDCAHPVYASVAAWKAWLTEVAMAAAAQGKYPAASWVLTGASDALADPQSDAGLPAGLQGAACVGPRDCKANFGCFSPTSTTGNAYCASYCTSQADCTSGTSCQSVVGVCVAHSVPTAGKPASSSCTVSVPGTGPNRWSFSVLLSALLAFRHARRRRRSRPEPPNDACRTE